MNLRYCEKPCRQLDPKKNNTPKEALSRVQEGYDNDRYSGSQVLCHSQLRPVIDSLEFNFVHEGLNQLQSPATPAPRIFFFIPGVSFLAVLANQICRHNATARNSND